MVETNYYYDMLLRRTIVIDREQVSETISTELERFSFIPKMFHEYISRIIQRIIDKIFIEDTEFSINGLKSDDLEFLWYRNGVPVNFTNTINSNKFNGTYNPSTYTMFAVLSDKWGHLPISEMPRVLGPAPWSSDSFKECTRFLYKLGYYQFEIIPKLATISKEWSALSKDWSKLSKIQDDMKLQLALDKIKLSLEEKPM
jgi:hypothetical protein